MRADVFEKTGPNRTELARTVAGAMTALEAAPRYPYLGDDVSQWLPARFARVLSASRIHTLVNLTVRLPRRRQWWRAIDGLGVAGAKTIEKFFAAATLTDRARELIAVEPIGEVVPWDQLTLRPELDGSHGAFRAPKETCALSGS